MIPRSLSLVLVVFLVSCSNAGPADLYVLPFIGGVHGIFPTVLDGAPPPTVTDFNTYPFAVSFVLENTGEADVGPGTENPFALVRLSGINPKDWGLTDADTVQFIDTPLTRARKNFDGTIIPGELMAMTFEPLSFQPKIAGSELFTIQGELCYDYSTHTTIKICIKDNIIENYQDSTLCSLRGDLEPLNSGSQLHVVEARQNPVGNDRIQVNLVIKNLGTGVFFSRADSTDTACTFDLRNPTIYKALVVVQPVDTANYQLDCRGLDNDKTGFGQVSIPAGSDFGVIKFHSDAPRSISCFLEKASNIQGRVFQDLLNVQIYYRYGMFMDIPVLVQDFGLV